MRTCDVVTSCTKKATWRRLKEVQDNNGNTTAACDEHKDERLGWVKMMQEKP